jgi:T4 bacteriophage base plate protein
MRSLLASELLDVWERGLSQSSLQRALTLLAAACPDIPSEQLVHLSIGQRDGFLLSLREKIFGSQLVSHTVCPKCRDRLELTFSVSDIRVVPEIEPASVLVTKVENYKVQYRLPTSLDLGQVAGQSDLPRMRQQLLSRCLISAHYKDEALELSELPEALLSTVLEAMAQADPQADVQLALTCPACNHQWQVTFDVVSFFWSEIHGWARRLLQEIHTLASVYSWSEADILSMSAQRRQLYLEMISG